MKYNRLHFQDLGAANENIFLEASNQGLIMHEIGGFDVQRAIEVFKIPEDLDIGMMIAIGYQENHSVLPESFLENANSPRDRKKLSEILFVEEIGKSLE